MLNGWYLLLGSVLLSIQAKEQENKSGRPRRATEAVDVHLLSLVVDHVVENEASLKHLISHLIN